MKTKNEVIEYINKLTGYQGYIQFSHRPIDKEKDVFHHNTEKNILNEDGFIYEAHLCNEKESISIRQINDTWLVSKVDISNMGEQDIEVYFAKVGKIRMAQIWEEEVDELCENMKVKKIKHVVFAGFEGEKK